MSSSISNLLSRCKTIPTLQAALVEQAKDPSWSLDLEGELWIRWGRGRIGARLLEITVLVVGNATYGETSAFQAVQDAARGASHNWMFHLLNRFSDLCLENGWPFYGACIVDQAGNIPAGFSKWYVKNVPVLQHRPLKDLQAECLTSAPPTAHEMGLAISKYIYKNKL
jgi:hypothetical protein